MTSVPKNTDDKMMMIWSSTRVELSVWARSSALALRPVEFVGIAMIDRIDCKISEVKENSTSGIRGVVSNSERGHGRRERDPSRISASLRVFIERRLQL